MNMCMKKCNAKKFFFFCRDFLSNLFFMAFVFSIVVFFIDHHCAWGIKQALLISLDFGFVDIYTTQNWLRITFSIATSYQHSLVDIFSNS